MASDDVLRNDGNNDDIHTTGKAPDEDPVSPGKGTTTGAGLGLVGGGAAGVAAGAAHGAALGSIAGPPGTVVGAAIGAAIGAGAGAAGGAAAGYAGDAVAAGHDKQESSDMAEAPLASVETTPDRAGTSADAVIGERTTVDPVDEERTRRL